MSYFAKIIQIIMIVVIVFTDWITNIYGEDNGGRPGAGGFGAFLRVGFYL